MVDVSDLTDQLPAKGLGDEEAFSVLAEQVRTRSADLGAPDAFAHMDPAPAGIAARLVGLNAEYNQNLLHPDLSPFATEAEARVIAWLAPYFGMTTGHMCCGSTLANLAALWCAREHGATRVIASADAHVSVPKCAQILGLPFESLPVAENGRMTIDALTELSGAMLVLTAGTTGRGVIDELDIAKLKSGSATHTIWVHVDAAWGGPLRLTTYADRLSGIERADSVAVSAHKWLFQPKDSALVFFADPTAQEAIAFGSSYLANPNIGVQGSRSAAGIALLGTLLAWGQEGVAKRIETGMAQSEELARRLQEDRRTELKQFPETGVVNWRPLLRDTEMVISELGPAASRTAIKGEPWVRQVAANMHADIDAVWARISRVLGPSD
ncbi:MULTISPECIES: pyridoxal-dependent decarboxylase [unclassified Roseibium]|uniref:pyridoxal phosphate-dependent decarboxylase family protein n=1 Tax=unclassified Roseibium TaxID=2629323 RepID=UPI00273D803D|nr:MULTISPECIES: pyridoxal-dependent decarboxylase [unclassified Roseibium]